MVTLMVLAWSAAQPTRAQDAGNDVVLIRDATILTASHGRIDRGSILIRDGKIAAVGASVDAPGTATVIDASGLFVTPGIIDCHSHMAVEGGVNEGSISVSSMVGTDDVLDSTDIDLYRAVAGGVTTANILHGSANAIGGRNAVIKLRWGKDADDLRFEGALPGIKFALGENPKRSNSSARPGTERRYPATRMGVVDVIRQAFTEAVEYRAKWRRYEAGGRSGVPPARDLRLETLVEVLEGERLVHAHAYRADEILQLLRVAEELGFKIATFQHVLEGYKVADEIAEHGAGASTFSDWWAYKVEAFDAIPYNAALMTERGVVVSINSDSAEEVRHLNQEAAKAIKYGDLSEEQALQLVTLNPARQLRIDARVGSIDEGKDADLVLWKNHPLSVYGVAQKVYIDGQLYFDREKDLAQRTAREKEKQELLAKARAREDADKEKAAPKRPTVETTTSRVPKEQQP
ncbi:MAG: amidohydrolase family protein [Luteitalea sp.]|nr:amidohydrolase family protein [Luteitalea sp.]